MFLVTIIGNLGADAVVESSNGQTYTRFRVADSRRYKDGQGNSHEETQWFSCIMSGDAAGLLPYLKKGQMVYVVGRGSTRIYSSPKLRQMVASVDISVRLVELVGRPNDDAVPRQVADGNGVLHDVQKFYSIRPEEAAAICGGQQSQLVYSANGSAFQLMREGWVSPLAAQPMQASNNNEQLLQDGSSGVPFTGDDMPDVVNVKNKKDGKKS